MPRRLAATLFLLTPVLGWAADTQPTPTAAQLEFFEKEVRPVLIEHCYKCHGEKKQKSNLRLDSRAFILKGGEVGPVIDLSKPEQSRLLLAINHAKAKDVEPMPSADEKIPDKAIAALTEWVKQGLPWPSESGPAVHDPRKHWAFQPVANPPLPALDDKAAARVRQPLDRFVIAKLAANGLALSPDASRETYVRRLYLTLWGLNPSAEEVEAYVKDTDPRADEKLVDRLLAAPAFGERWGRHWLDVARYADTKGYVFQEERRYPYAYTYRDWVVNAFNTDLPYDQFLRLQIAADKIVTGENNRDLAALGFLTLGRRFLNSQQDIIDDRIDVVMRGTQGLTMGCARCHDHKSDPIPTADYYSLYAIFNSSEEPKEKPLLKPFTPTKESEEFEAELAAKQKKLDDFITSRRELSFGSAKTAAYLALVVRAEKDTKFDAVQEAKRANLYSAVLAGWRKVLKPRLVVTDPVWGGWLQLHGVPDAAFSAKLDELLKQPNQLQDPLLRGLLEKKKPANFTDLTAAYATLLADARLPENTKDAARKPWRDLIESPVGPTAPTAISLVPSYNTPDRNTRSKLEGDVEGFKATSPKSPPRAMAMVDKPKPAQGVIFLRGSPGRPGKTVPRQFLEILSNGPREEYKNGSGRLDLANSIARKDNPLTARVLVNRVWNQVFGAPLVETPSDFGVRTAAPKNPEVLEHLAAGFMENGWSMKKLIRTMVLSSVFRQSSAFNPAGAAKDSDNTLLWRMNRRRLDFEAMRDSMLRVTGRLDSKVGGQPFDLIADFGNPRRTLYSFIDRQNLPAVFRTFDFANPDYHVAKRNVTTTPQQALWMINHPFGRQQADLLAQGVAAQPLPEAKVAALFNRILSRNPSKAEVAQALEFISDAEKSPAPAAWQSGYGGWDEKTKQVTFTAMAQTKGEKVFPNASDKQEKVFTHTFLTAKGGHPGDNQKFAVIRRWSAGGGGLFRIEGSLHVPSKASDGVRARLVSSRRGLLAEWITPGEATVATTLDKVDVAPGETLDFIVDSYRNPNSDSFAWAPMIKDAKTGETIASAATEFTVKTNPQSAWSALAQVLLESNEFNFAD